MFGDQFKIHIWVLKGVIVTFRLNYSIATKVYYTQGVLNLNLYTNTPFTPLFLLCSEV